MRLKRSFYNRDTVTVARELLGKYLVRKIPSASSGQAAKIIKVRITETEAYCGQKDKACHASKGLTPRTKIMFGPPGHAYVYMIYGMYHCLNFVTRKEACPEAVLIRSAELGNYALRITDYKKNSQSAIRNSLMNSKLNGPGKLCRELKIDGKLNGVDIIKSKELWVEDDNAVTAKIKKGKRIGVDYAGSYKNKPWRFWI